MKKKKFTRTKEDFVCGHCGFGVAGDGYTNHCPKCLWSRHVDVNPGDRAEKCGGMMRPVSVETKGGIDDIVHRCAICSFIRKNIAAKNDNFDAIIEVIKSRDYDQKNGM